MNKIPLDLDTIRETAAWVFKDDDRLTLEALISEVEALRNREAYSFLISNLIKGKKKPHIENLN